MLTAIRKFYRIPVDVFAAYLGISKSHLSMSDAGKRKVKNTEGMRSFYLASLLEPKTTQFDQKTDQELAVQEKDLKRSIGRKLNINEYRLSQAKKLLAKMKEDQASSFRILRTIPALRTKAVKKELQLLRFIENNTRILQRKTNPNAQLKLELKIQSLQAQVNYLKKQNK